MSEISQDIVESLKLLMDDFTHLGEISQDIVESLKLLMDEIPTFEDFMLDEGYGGEWKDEGDYNILLYSMIDNWLDDLEDTESFENDKMQSIFDKVREMTRIKFPEIQF